ncbi:MAG TPA: DUF1028 domain-containing protein [Thermoanaerobaculia bacterium]|nr:DUF1028 domain-containing protein [Thermoanaerobaculia bacterium]
MRSTILIITFLLAAPSTFAADPRAHTFSIVARDPATGELGVAVQSHWFSVGSVVPWAESGVGAVATQSIAEPSYGPLGLALMRAGRTAPEALKALTSTDAQIDLRQVAMIDAKGNVAAHTGRKAIAAAGDQVGVNYSVQANLMRNATIWPAMAAAFEKTKGDLADRLVAALEAGQRAGGDIRGRQSAALIIVRGTPSGKPWTDRMFDLRVEDAAEPIVELKRLVRLQRAYNYMNRGDELAGEKKWTEAMEQYRLGAGLAPEIEELPYWVAVTLFTAGREDEALPIFKDVFRRNRDWVEVTRRLPASGFLPDDPAKLQKILNQAEMKP